MKSPKETFHEMKKADPWEIGLSLFTKVGVKGLELNLHIPMGSVHPYLRGFPPPNTSLAVANSVAFFNPHGSIE